MKILEQQIKGGFFLSSMMGITDGAFCARTLEGDHKTAMVQTGAYLAEPSATAEDKGADAPCFLPAGAEACAAFLAADIRPVQLTADDMVIWMNLATPKLTWGLEEQFLASSFHRFPPKGFDLSRRLPYTFH